MAKKYIKIPFSLWFRTSSTRILFMLLLSILFLSVFSTRLSRIGIKYSRLYHISDNSQDRRAKYGSPLQMAETLYLPPDIILKLLSLGREQFLSDLIFIRAHSYFLSHFFSDRIFQWLDNYVQAIIALDSENPKVYMWASQVVKYKQTIDNNAIKKSNEYALMGIKKFPEDWKLYFQVGFNLYFEYQPENDEEKKIIREEALYYFSMGAQLPGSKLDPNFIAELYFRKNETRLALLYAYQKYYEASEEEKKSLLNRIETIEKGASKELKREEDSWKTNYPYIPIHLYTHVGAKIALHKPILQDELGKLIDEYETERESEE